MDNKGLRMTGFADEASPRLEAQIAVTREAGWNSIELRSIDGKNICTLDDAAFAVVEKTMLEAGMRASCFASAIANWARPITTDLAIDLADLKRAIPRMSALDTSLIRIMSYPNAQWEEKDWRNEVIRRIGILTRIAEDEGITLLLENCDGWASESPDNLGYLLETIDSSALRVVFDSGNTISHGGSKELNWAFYRAALPYIQHFHIKDCRWEAGKAVHTYPGEGNADVLALMRDLNGRGYQGMFSIEPHIHSQIHTDTSGDSEVVQVEMFRTYAQIANSIFDQLQL